MTTLVFDCTVLSHFARSGQLDALQELVKPYNCITPGQVILELLAGSVVHPELTTATALSWVDEVELTALNEVVAFARYKADLGGRDDENNGEAAVLAWVATHGGIALIDEEAGRRFAERDNLVAHPTLWLVANACKAGLIARGACEAMVDALHESMRLPVDGAGFFAWAHREGWLP